MRIISGDLRGRKFSGAIPNGTRPTADNVRETIFNVLANYFDLQGALVLDLCAGTGAFGFEALSRGAEHITLVDKNRKATEYIAKAAENFKIDDEQISIKTADAVTFLKRYAAQQDAEQFDLIFTDPPYNLKIVNQINASIVELDLLKPGGIMIAEHGFDEAVDIPKGWTKLTEKTWPGKKLEVFEKDEA
ncbi:MAG TPA: 16S rRNA (guanine(966)-N(2))-methyltransferase RsmD [Patescibacteria group bacterium]|nr:16S rRNA (guanine(966)-N(2))-methyltransferase RsmD [Patescibacteria group bacterium]